ncbi:MAG: hypothetical protein QW265_02160 [Candidatus Bathyarchaeia archaeon]
MLVAYEYRIYPKPLQERLLKSHLAMPCNLYNELRDLKIDNWKLEHASLSENDLRLIALDMRRKDGELQKVYSQVCQNVATRVVKAFKNYLKEKRFPKRKGITSIFKDKCYSLSSLRCERIG